MKHCLCLALFTSFTFSPYLPILGQSTGQPPVISAQPLVSDLSREEIWTWQRYSNTTGEFPIRHSTSTSYSPFSTTLLRRKEPHFPWFLLDERSPYKTNFRKGGPVVGVGAFLVGASILARVNETALTLDQVNQLDRRNVWGLDRSATYQYSTSAGTVSDVLLYSSIAAPLLYVIPKHTRSDFGRIVILQFETGLMAYGIVSLTKSLARRIRPFAYNANAPLSDKLTINAKESFFSGHTSTTAAMSFFTATTFSQYYPDSPLKPWVWTYAVAWPAATGYLRYRAGSHFLSDVVVGYVIGATTGFFIPKIHQRIRSSKRTVLPLN